MARDVAPQITPTAQACLRVRLRIRPDHKPPTHNDDDAPSPGNRNMAAPAIRCTSSAERLRFENLDLDAPLHARRLHFVGMSRPSVSMRPCVLLRLPEANHAAPCGETLDRGLRAPPRCFKRTPSERPMCCGPSSATRPSCQRALQDFIRLRARRGPHSHNARPRQTPPPQRRGVNQSAMMSHGPTDATPTIVLPTGRRQATQRARRYAYNGASGVRARSEPCGTSGETRCRTRGGMEQVIPECFQNTDS